MTVCPLTHPANTYTMLSGCQAPDWAMPAVSGTYSLYLEVRCQWRQVHTPAHFRKEFTS